MPRACRHQRAAAAAAVLALQLACGAPEDEDLELHRGVNALDERRYELARQHLAADLERHPERLESLRLAAGAWMAGPLQSPTRAVEYWRRYLELRPGDGDVAMQLTRTLHILGEWQEAEAWSERLDSSIQAQLLRARIFLDSDLSRAQGALEAAAGSDSDEPLLHHLAAQVYDQAGDSERARDHAARAVALSPFDLKSTYLLARLERQLGHPEEAERMLAVHQLLTRLSGTGSAPEPTPAEALRLLLELEPLVDWDSPELRLRKLRLLVANGRREEAREILGEIADRDTPPPATLLELAGLAERIGELDSARDLLERSLREEALDDKSEGKAHEGRRREALYGLALLSRREGESDRAFELTRRCIDQFPQTARCHHLLGKLELESGRNDRAESSFLRALELAPWKSDCRIDLANLWLIGGRLDEVAALLDRAPLQDAAIEAYRKRQGLQ